MLEAVGVAVIFIHVDVTPGSVAGFAGAVEAVGAGDAGVDRGVGVRILAVVDGGALDFGNGGIDISNGVGGLGVESLVGGEPVKVGAHEAEILKGVEISGMVTTGLGLGRSAGSQCQTDSEQSESEKLDGLHLGESSEEMFARQAESQLSQR